MAEKVYTCKTCGAVATEKGHLCAPIEEMATCACACIWRGHAKRRAIVSTHEQDSTRRLADDKALDRYILIIRFWL